MGEYQKGDLDIANAAYDIAKANYDRAERALAVARHDLTWAERNRSEKFKSLVEKSTVVAPTGDQHDSIQAAVDADNGGRP